MKCVIVLMKVLLIIRYKEYEYKEYKIINLNFYHPICNVYAERSSLAE